MCVYFNLCTLLLSESFLHLFFVDTQERIICFTVRWWLQVSRGAISLSPPLAHAVAVHAHTHTHTHTHTLLLFFHTTDGTAAILGVFILAKLLPQTVYARAAHGAKTCVGIDCFFYTHLALVGVEALGAAFACLLVYRSRKLFAQRRRMRLSGH